MTFRVKEIGTERCSELLIERLPVVFLKEKDTKRGKRKTLEARRVG